MGWRFRQSFSPIPGVRVTLSPSGLSTSVGVGPFRVSVGSSGVRGSVSVPGTGLSYSTSLLPGAERPSGGTARPGPATANPGRPPQQAGTELERVGSASNEAITSQGLAEFKRLLVQSNTLHRQVSQSLEVVFENLTTTQAKYSSWESGWFMKRIRPAEFARMQESITELEAERAELQEQLQLSVLAADFDVPERVAQAYSSFVDAFKGLTKVAKVWDNVGQRATDRVRERTTAGRVIDRQEVRATLGGPSSIRTSERPPRLGNANGGDLLFLPAFVVVYNSASDLGLVELGDISMTCTRVRFNETEPLVPGARVVGKTWVKANKDGSPDRRFKDNFQIPVVEYGYITIKSQTGLHEEYMVSDCAVTDRLGHAWSQLRGAVAQARSA
jgi:hypothetical protein